MYYNEIRFTWYNGERDEKISMVRYFPGGFRSKFQGIMKLIVKLSQEYNMYFQLSEVGTDILIVDCDYDNTGGFMLKGFIQDIKVSYTEFLDLKDLR